MPNSSGAEEEDQARLARAYNNSIYLMAGMPYLLLGVVGFLIYRGLRQRAQALSLSQALPLPPDHDASADRAPGGQGARSCPPPSPGVAS